MAYRDDLLALGHRKAALAEELEQKTQELNDAAHIYAEAAAKLRLPVLDNLRVATPCHVSWASMTGDERARHCRSCKKDVFNLSGMTRDEAEALIIDKHGDLCVRYYQRQDGTILLEDCSVGVGKRRRKQRVLAASALALLASASASYLRLGSKDRIRTTVAGAPTSEVEPQARFPAPPAVDPWAGPVHDSVVPNLPAPNLDGTMHTMGLAMRPIDPDPVPAHKPKPPHAKRPHK